MSKRGVLASSPDLTLRRKWNMQSSTALAPIQNLRSLLTADPVFLFQNKFNRLFEPFLDETLPLTTWVPACDIYETDKEMIVKAELPGLKKEDVIVSIDNNVLMLRGERRFADEVKREDFHRVERAYGEFLRSFTLPAFIDTTKILAEFKDGLLMVTLPKREEAKPKQIDIKVK
jgi:HSP20 family protein